MNSGIIDIFIILVIILGGIVGFKNGAIKEGTKFLGTFIMVMIAFVFKDKLAVLLYENLPYFNFFGAIRGIDAINILLYQLVAFLIIFCALLFALRVLLVITGLIEWILKMTVFLSLPSKLLGIVVGIIEYYVYLFIILYVLNMPLFNLEFINESKFGNMILEKTPILSNYVDDTVKVYTKVWDIINNRKDLDTEQVNTLVLATLLDNKLITIESAKELVSSNYIVIEDASILDNYNSEKNFFDYVKERYND